MLSENDEERVHSLEAKDCYVGQRVYWIMWCEPNQGDEPIVGTFYPRTNAQPEILSDVVEKLTPKTITLEKYGRKHPNIYSCPQDAITAEFETFCVFHLSPKNYYLFRHYGQEPIRTLGEVSVVLRKLAELEYRLNNFNNLNN